MIDFVLMIIPALITGCVGLMFVVGEMDERNEIQFNGSEIQKNN